MWETLKERDPPRSRRYGHRLRPRSSVHPSLGFFPHSGQTMHAADRTDRRVIISILMRALYYNRQPSIILRLVTMGALWLAYT